MASEAADWVRNGLIMTLVGLSVLGLFSLETLSGPRPHLRTVMKIISLLLFTIAAISFYLAARLATGSFSYVSLALIIPVILIIIVVLII